ncbi:MAG: hypothetical protein KME32_36370 [Mojavia pulchra JT2-VF2]|uniref:S-layer family protein n=1 Tax=Mojavia pulchra JT2-VF2 TaxID=287848 RepID=A0A951UK82_9NOST|nr:hypothetical protein [Mojavia pulchra JT2-VF2]
MEVLRKPTANAGSSITSLAQRGSTGAGGNIKIETVRLSLRSGGVISSGTFGQGSGGNVSITASEGVQVIGKSLTGNSPSRISARTGGTGKAGNLTIETGRLTVTDGGRVNIGGEKIQKNLNFQPGQGNAGTLRINADIINLDIGTITAGTVSGTEGEGGDIFLHSSDLRLRNSVITATTGGDGDGGNITINTDILAALENSSITANAFEGRGGNIQINTRGFFLSPDSQVTANSERGVNGIVQINLSENQPKITKPQTEAILVTPKITSVCQGRSNSTVSNNRFVITGTNGLPPNPDDIPDTNLAWHDNSILIPLKNRLEETKSTALQETVKIVEAQGWRKTADGTIILTAEPNTVIISTSPSAHSCKSSATQVSGTEIAL